MNDDPTIHATPVHRVDLSFLSAYPHVAACSDCQFYAGDCLDLDTAPAVLVATLAHHDSAHQSDPFTVASQHFG